MKYGLTHEELEVIADWAPMPVATMPHSHQHGDMRWMAKEILRLRGLLDVSARENGRLRELIQQHTDGLIDCGELHEVALVEREIIP